MFIISIVDTSQWRKNYRIARDDSSPIMELQWRLRRAKSFADLSVLIALLLSFSLPGFPGAVYIDPVVSLVIIGFLLFAGYLEISSSLSGPGRQNPGGGVPDCHPEGPGRTVRGVHGVPGVRSRRSGSHISIEILPGFDPEQKMGEVQDSIDSLKMSIEKKIPGSIVSIIPTDSTR